MAIRTLAGDSAPAGSARVAVRGFFASILTSINRFSDIAAVRAPTIASAMNSNWRVLGSPLAAKKAAENAKGSAKMVCENLIISKNMTVFLYTPVRESKLLLPMFHTC